VLYRSTSAPRRGNNFVQPLSRVFMIMNNFSQGRAKRETRMVSNSTCSYLILAAVLLSTPSPSTGWSFKAGWLQSSPTAYPTKAINFTKQQLRHTDEKVSHIESYSSRTCCADKLLVCQLMCVWAVFQIGHVNWSIENVVLPLNECKVHFCCPRLPTLTLS
jgi:hypothetical protein